MSLWLLTAACATLQPLPPRGPGPSADVPARPAPAPTEARAADEAYFAENPLMVPVLGVAPSRLRDSFNEARSGGRTHQALDIPAPRGTPVLAAADGRVLAMRQNALGGTTLYVVDNANRFVYYYAHLERYADRISEGTEVKQGDVLGYVGTSGNAPRNAPHLHFQALRVDSGRRDWWNGRPVDVRSFLVLTGRERRL